MKIRMKMVINWDFLILNTQFHIVFPKHNLDFLPVSLRNTRFHIIFPQHNLNFSPVSLRNTRFHVVSMGKHKHKMVQWVWYGLKLIKEEKKQYISIFSQNSTDGILYLKILYCKFLICQFYTSSTSISNKILYDNYQYQFCNVKNWYDKNWYRYRACLRSCPCLV